MSCSHCTTAQQPAVDARSRFCVGCGRRLPLSALATRRSRLPLQRTPEEPAPAAVG